MHPSELEPKLVIVTTQIFNDALNKDMIVNDAKSADRKVLNN